MAVIIFTVMWRVGGAMEMSSSMPSCALASASADVAAMSRTPLHVDYAR